MTKLYVANCTKYVWDFLFKLPGQTQINAYRVTIPMGGQALVYKDSDFETLDFIIAQHEKYGLTKLSEIDRTKGFVGLCYQFDKPIDAERIMEAVSNNDEELEKRGHAQRKESAAALSNIIDNNLQGSDTKLQGVEVEFVEQPKVGDTSPRRNETIQVAKPGSKANARGQQRAEENR